MLSQKQVKLVMLVGPPGSGKSTFAKKYRDEGTFTYVNQDSQGKAGHREVFEKALEMRQNIIVDRMNFNKVQRLGYLEQAKAKGYFIEIHVFHQPYAVCMERALNRAATTGHETIKDEENARQAINFFFKTYERVEDFEADKVVRHYPEGEKPSAIICDLDGTLCDIAHRRHHVRPPEGKKKNWMAFRDGIKDDKLNRWCAEILHVLGGTHARVLCSGRGEEDREITEFWLEKHDVAYDALYMRKSGDSRQDALVKEIILDFEILTRWTPYLMIDDRQQVVDMWRKRGFVCLQCDKGDF